MMGKNLRFLFIEDNLAPLQDAVRGALEWGLDPSEVFGVLVNSSETSENVNAYMRQVFPVLPKDAFTVVKPAGVMEVAHEIGCIFRRERCHAAVCDLQLGGEHVESQGRSADYFGVANGEGPIRLFEGVPLSRVLNSDYGAYYLIWRTQFAREILRNPLNQVRLTGHAVEALQCPRVFVVQTDSGELTKALQAVYKDIFERLPALELEWYIPGYRLGSLRRLLHTGGSMEHAFQNATGEDLEAYASFELIQRSDPPSPFGLWLQSRKVQYLEEARAADSKCQRRAKGESLKQWLDRNLWGMPFADVKECVNRALNENRLTETDFNQDLSAMDDRTDGFIMPCVRSALVTAVGNALKNAHENKNKSGGRPVEVKVHLDKESSLFLLIVANPIDKASGIVDKVAKGLRVRGLSFISDCIRELNDVGINGTERRWGFQFGVWQNGQCLSDLTQEPWRCGVVPGEIANGDLPMLKDMTKCGDWATAVFVGPISSSR